MTAQATAECQPSTGAHAVHCVLDELNWYGLKNRPLAGYINFCPRDTAISTSASSMESLVDTAVHELVHTLFMSSDLFEHYISQEGAISMCATLLAPAHFRGTAMTADLVWSLALATSPHAPPHPFTCACPPSRS